jgi:S-adenosylmethionine synthetase
MEIVERKGLGHPDTICDALAEACSRSLSNYYLENFGMILHHNVDKALLCGGQALASFGGGEMIAPIEIYLAGRATELVGRVKVPVHELAIESSHRWLAENLRFVDVNRQVRIHCNIRPGSVELTKLFLGQQQAKMAIANDTSCGVGYAPLNTLENIVLQVEQYLNSHAVKAAYPAIGEDIKVMGVRLDNEINLTVACAIVGRFINDMLGYIEIKQKIAELTLLAANMAGARTGIEAVNVVVNAADNIAEQSIYLTVTGTSAENGDDGEVGRGNRANGLITFYRPMSMEALAGKNSVSHIGKLYNVLAQNIAHDIVSSVDGVLEVYCYLLGQIGQPIDQPAVADLKLRLASGVNLADIKKPVERVLEHHLAGIHTLWQSIIRGDISLF